MINDWLTEGASVRAPARIYPVIHLLVRDGEQAGGWAMWCSAGPGRPENPMGSRLCARCRKLAREAVDDGDLDANESVGRWLS